MFHKGFVLLAVIFAILINKVLLLELVEDKMDLQTLNWQVWCKFQKNEFTCSDKSKSTRYYFDIKMEGCRSFLYGYCENSYNDFISIDSCYDTCVDAGLAPFTGNYTSNVICQLQPDFGDCFDYHPMFYFDINSRSCRGFSYSGCGGNNNRFASVDICTSICAKSMDTF